MLLLAHLLLSLFLFNGSKAQKDPNMIPGRNTIIQMFEWKYSDIADECERFLQHHGYGGVQVSPVSENILVPGRPWWERYQPVSYLLTTRSGDEAAFLDMTTRCNNVGVRIYVDLIINHMSAPSDNPIGTGGSVCDPNGKEYPAVPYGPGDFHESCPINNYDDPGNVRNCELNELRDLNQGTEYVRTKLIEFMDHLVELGVGGFRVDAAKHMWPADLDYIYSHVRNLNPAFGFWEGARPFYYQEVINMNDNEAISREEYTGFGVVTEFRYGALLSNVFKGNDKLVYLESWGPEWGLINPPTNALAFIDNHDNQRGDEVLSYKTPKQYKMAIAFMLAHPYGWTRIISGYDFSERDQGPPMDAGENIISPEIHADDTCGNGWVCEHRWRQIYSMVEFKNVVAGTNIENWWSDGDQQIAFSRGNKGFIVFTNSGDVEYNLYTGLPAGKYCDVISGKVGDDGACTGKQIVVSEDGYAYVQLRFGDEDGVLAIHVNATL